MPYKIWIEHNRLNAKYKIRNYHIDSYGHVNNAVYIQFLEDARTDFFDFLGFSLSYLTKQNIFIYITEINIKYLKPGYLDDIIVVTASMLKHSKIRITWLQEIFKGNEKLTTAAVTGAFMNKEKKPIKIPDFVLTEMEKISLANQ
jgi:YbgC/YbaW family acyl-CoA thioester hydrolase